MHSEPIKSTERSGVARLTLRFGSPVSSGSSIPHRHRIGGSPTGIAGRGLPTCRHCRREFFFVAEFDVLDPQLGLSELESHAFVHLLTCGGCDSQVRSATHFARSKSGRSIHVRSQPSQALALEGGSAIRLPQRAIPITIDAADPTPNFEGPFHQWGGDPLWLGEPCEPDCSRCRTPLTFVVQIDTDAAQGIAFADAGMLYGFVCRACGEVATIVQVA